MLHDDIVDINIKIWYIFPDYCFHYHSWPLILFTGQSISKLQKIFPGASTLWKEILENKQIIIIAPRDINIIICCCPTNNIYLTMKNKYRKSTNLTNIRSWDNVIIPNYQLNITCFTSNLHPILHPKSKPWMYFHFVLFVKLHAGRIIFKLSTLTFFWHNNEITKKYRNNEISNFLGKSVHEEIDA